MKRYLKKFKNSILWEKISYSNLYQRIRFSDRVRENNKEFLFYRKLLGNKNKLIFDIGANSGEKAAILKKIATKVICFEPSPNSVRTLKRRFAYSNVSVLPVAISDKTSLSKLYVVDGRETLNSISDKQLSKVILHAAKGSNITTIYVPTETLDNVIRKLGVPEYIKIDVEGSEKEVITGLSTPVRFLSFENCTPVFLNEGIESINHLEHISNGKAVFNIYVEGAFIFKSFSTSDIVKKHLRNNNYPAAEIFCHAQ